MELPLFSFWELNLQIDSASCSPPLAFLQRVYYVLYVKWISNVNMCSSCVIKYKICKWATSCLRDSQQKSVHSIN